jgi:carboxyl-terminal processing protease
MFFMKGSCAIRLKRSFYLMAILSLGAGQISDAQVKDSIKVHVDSAINILKSHSLYSNQVNWRQLTSKIYKSLDTCKTKADTFAALKTAFNALGDRHAAFYHYDNQYRIENTELISRYSDSLKSEWKKGPRILTYMIGTKSYIRIPYIGATKPTDIERVTKEIRDKVHKLAVNKPKGWIIDLRLNAGGNIRPMLAGLSAFFQDGILGYYVNRDGIKQEQIEFRKGELIINNESPIDRDEHKIDLKGSDISILIGPGTGSSGEGLAIYLKQRGKSKLFGEPTAGLANSTQGFIFDNDNAYFLISVSRLANRHGKILPMQISPDFRVVSNDHFSDPDSDKVIMRAIQWLDQHS